MRYYTLAYIIAHISELPRTLGDLFCDLKLSILCVATTIIFIIASVPYDSFLPPESSLSIRFLQSISFLITSGKDMSAFTNLNVKPAFRRLSISYARFDS